MKTSPRSISCGADRLLSDLLLVLLLLGVTLLASRAGAAPDAHRASAPPTSADSTFSVEARATDTWRDAERAFVGKALGLSRQQVWLAELAVGQAANAAVRSHALLLGADYRALVDALDALSRRKGGVSAATVDASAPEARALAGKAGAEFDREYVRRAGHLSDETLTRFEQIASEAKDEDVKALAAAQLPVLRKHSSALTELRKTFD